ncbi:MAG: tRNA-specific 2-thiouridylase MnmA [candidate division TM6 bacterium GW2011_GWF2_28_16]|nr:MAG: tRNA-specific 2-thiouridylase MnmA [candidate division TM6 bacterium GW2011_GWF2_28_16]
MKIAVLLSGGVDSSVALKLLHDQGHDLTAYYLKIWLEDEVSYLGQCPWEEDLKFASAVCSQLNVPLKVVNMQKEYWDKIVSYTISEVKSGRTPSPDIFCNKQIKFGAFFDVVGNDFDKIATGHYARIEKQENKFLLKKAKDSFKDQTYFLSHLNQEQLAKLIFPIGDLKKEEVRKIAIENNLANANRKDSQGICFLGKIKFSDFIKNYLGEKKGDLIEFETGKVLGSHEGFWYYTIGQRKGIGLSGGPWFVVAKDTEKNIIYISSKYYSQEKSRKEFIVLNFNWISGETPDSVLKEKENLQVKIRHGEYLYNCKLSFIEANKAKVVLDKDDQGIASGQFAVFYDDEICLGCGKIE